jgi:hypothetical protein
MKKTRKNMLRSSAAMLLVSALALTTATYAWFTKGDTGRVQNLTLQAEAASGIQLSADAKNWKSTITATDLNDTSLGNSLPTGEVSPLSSTGALGQSEGTYGTLVLYQLEQELDSEYVTTAADTTGGSNVMRFDFYVKNDNDDTGATLLLDFDDSNKSSVTATKDGETDKGNGIQDAVRVAFIRQGYVKTSTSGYASTVLTKKTDASTANLIWEPNSKEHVKYGGNSYIDTYAIKAAFNKSMSVKISDNGTIDKNFSSVVAKQSTFKESDLGDATSVSLGEIPGQSITKFTVYVWFEGQDVDCTNKESGGNITIDLKFKKGTTSSN